MSGRVEGEYRLLGVFFGDSRWHSRMLARLNNKKIG